MNKQGRFTAVLLSGVILCGIGTGCTADGSKTAKADYTWSNVAIGGGGYVTGMEYNPKEEGLSMPAQTSADCTAGKRTPTGNR